MISLSINLNRKRDLSWLIKIFFVGIIMKLSDKGLEKIVNSVEIYRKGKVIKFTFVYK